MGYENRRYSVVPHRNEWREMYEREAVLIRGTLGAELIFIEHVGSTAVPGLGGKPTLDVLATVRDIQGIDRYTFAFKAIGYHSQGEAITKNSRLFVKSVIHENKEEERLVNLHIFPDEHPEMMRMIDIRDYLMAHPDEARTYHEFKEKLFKKYPNDYAVYREKKDEFFKKLLKKATKWKGRRVSDERGSVY